MKASQVPKLQEVCLTFTSTQGMSPHLSEYHYNCMITLLFSCKLLAFLIDIRPYNFNIWCRSSHCPFGSNTNKHYCFQYDLTLKIRGVNTEVFYGDRIICHFESIRRDYLFDSGVQDVDDHTVEFEINLPLRHAFFSSARLKSR